MGDQAKENSIPASTSLRASRQKHILPSGEMVQRSYLYHNEPISSYEESFAKVLEGRSIADLIRTRPIPIVIDLMAPPGTVNELLSTFPSGRGLAVSIPDHDTKALPEEDQLAYDSQLVKWIPKDITQADTWKEVQAWLQGDKAHLIMERGMGALRHLPMHKLIYGILVNKSWANLDPNGGILLFETPNKASLAQNGIDIDAWIKVLKNAVDTRYDPGKWASSNPQLETGKIMITRTPNSPAVLPAI